METNNVLQNEVSDVYQKTLMSIPESAPSFSETVDNDFINSFIMYFNGSRLDNVPMDVSDERCRQKVIALFKEIENDLHETRNSHVDVSSLSSDMDILRLYLDGKKEWDEIVKRALYNAQNMASTDQEVADVVNQVYEKRQSVKAYMKPTGGTYEYTKDGIRDYFVNKGVIEETTNNKGRLVDKIVADAMVNRPSEVEELMSALSRLVETASTVSDRDTCRWVGEISVSGVKIGRQYLEETNPDNSAVRSAKEACERVAAISQHRFGLLKQNTVTDAETSLASTADPYMKFIFGMIKDGKVSKDVNGPITVVDVNSITPKDIINLATNVKHALFQLGPKSAAADNDPVEFDDKFDTNVQLLKQYIDFMSSDELNPVVAMDKSIKDRRTRLTAAYILTKAVHDTFNGGIMLYSKTDTMLGEHKIPSLKTFSETITKTCAEFPKTDIDINYVFNYKVMFSTETPYFPIEQIISQNPSMYNRMCQYRRSCMEAYTSLATEKAEKEGKQVEYIAPKFAERFNKLMKGAAAVDKYCECNNLKVSTTITAPQFADAFNAVSEGIAYAARNDVNDKETEYKLWSILKTLANKTPPSLGDEAKHEFINVAHAQDDIMYRMNLAVKAGVVSKSKGFHFSGNFGTIENGNNIQAKRIDQIMKLFYKYIVGLMFEHTKDALQNIGYTRPMSIALVKPYFATIFGIAKEYNIAFQRNNAKSLGCSCKWSDAIVVALEQYSTGGNDGR